MVPLAHPSVEFISQMASRPVQLFMHYYDRQTERPRYSVCNNSPHLCRTVMQPKTQKLDVSYSRCHGC